MTTKETTYCVRVLVQSYLGWQTVADGFLTKAAAAKWLRNSEYVGFADALITVDMWS